MIAKIDHRCNQPDSNRASSSRFGQAPAVWYISTM
jgi:hypothetical protein